MMIYRGPGEIWISCVPFVSRYSKNQITFWMIIWPTTLDLLYAKYTRYQIYKKSVNAMLLNKCTLETLLTSTSTERNVPIECLYCSKRFKIYSLYLQHFKVHVIEYKLWKCFYFYFIKLKSENMNVYIIDSYSWTPVSTAHIGFLLFGNVTM